MRVATWLPRGLREELAALDPARTTAPARPRPELEDVLARAARLQDSPGPGLDPLSGEKDVSARQPGSRHHPGRGPVLLSTACSVVLIAGLATGITLATRSHHTQRPGQTAAGIPHPTGSGAAGSGSLYGVTWLDTASRATVVFAAGTAHVSDGCSGQTRALSVTGHHLKLGALQPGGYLCGGRAAPQPGSPGYRAYQRDQHALSRFYRVLDSTPAWSITEHQLTLTSPIGRTLTLTSQGTAPLTLPGSRWSLQLVIPINPKIGEHGFHGRLAFDRHGRFRATDGSADILTGTATIKGDQVTFKPDPDRYRGPRKSSLSVAVDTMLSARLHYQIEDNTLRLSKPDTHGLLIYAPAPG